MNEGVIEWMNELMSEAKKTSSEINSGVRGKLFAASERRRRKKMTGKGRQRKQRREKEDLRMGCWNREEGTDVRGTQNNPSVYGPERAKVHSE